MKIAEILEYVFGADQTDIVAFDDASEINISNCMQDDIHEDQLILDMPDGHISVVCEEKAYAIVSKDLPIHKANIVINFGKDKLGVFVLQDPIDVTDDILDSELSFPIPAMGYTASFGEESLHIYKELREYAALPDKDNSEQGSVETPNESSRSGEKESDEEVHGPIKFNDAEVLGDHSLDLTDFLAQEFTFMLGDLYPKERFKGTKDGEWKPATATLSQWLKGDGKTRGLSVHPEGKTKDGASLVPSFNFEGARTDKAVQKMYAIGIDIDAVTSLDHTITKLEEAGIFAIVYTTFNHMSETLELKHDEVMRKLRIDATPTRLQIQEYLTQHHSTRFERDFIQEIEVVESRKQTKDGQVIVLKVPPIDKFRVVIPLAEPVELADLAPTLQQWKTIWADAVTGVCVNMLDAVFDTASCDVNRLFYTPRHPKGDENWYSAIIMGKPLRFEDIEQYSRDKYVQERKAQGDPFSAGTEDFAQREQFQTASGMDLGNWNRITKDRFQLADLLETECSDKIRMAGGEKYGTVHIECPFEHQHSSQGGTACMAMNPEAQEHEVWTVFCRHDSCKGRDKLEFLNEMLEQHWFDESVLKDESFVLPSNYPEEGDTKSETEESSENKKTPAEEAADFDENSTEEEISKFIKRHHKMGVDRTTRAAINNALVGRVLLTKRDLNAIWKEYDRAKAAKDAEIAAEDLENFDGFPIVNMWDFKKMVEWGHKRIQTHNLTIPTLFHYMDGIARVRQNAAGKWHIHILNKDEFASELNRITTWNHQTMVGDQTRTRGVSAPHDVVNTIYSDIDAVYPPLRGVVTSPTFTREGDMITERGYHDSGLFYEPDITLDIPKVSKVPTEEEVRKSVRMLVADTFSDFPFGGYVREEIVDMVMDGEGIPAVTHCISMLLLFFCRDMIDGPTPGHLLGKPAPGTGASLLTDVVSIIATGSVTPASAMPGNPEEMGKTITALLASGTNMIFFDNINHGVDSAELASALTSPEYKARILGKTELVDTEVRCIWTLTGNNVQLSSEILRRCVLIDLDAQSAEPEKRTGWQHEDIRAWVKDNRGDLVWACLTIIQNWIAKGMNPYRKEALNSFENWSAVMGGIVRDAGIGGFLGNRQELKEMSSDGKENDIILFVEELWRNYGAKWVDTRDSPDPQIPSLIGMSLAADLPLNIKKNRNADDAMTFNLQQFDKFLNQYRDRVFRLRDGTEVRLEKGAKSQELDGKWRVQPMMKAPQSNV